jgi:hypothetical protein
MATAVKATRAAGVMLVSDTAVMLMAIQSVANGGPDGNNGSVAIPMQ